MNPKYAIHVLGKTYYATDANDALNAMKSGAGDVSILMAKTLPAATAKMIHMGNKTFITNMLEN